MASDTPKKDSPKPRSPDDMPVEGALERLEAIVEEQCLLLSMVLLTSDLEKFKAVRYQMNFMRTTLVLISGIK